MDKDWKRVARLIVVVSLALGTLLLPDAAWGGWHSQADELPGMVSTKTLIIVGVVTAVVITAVLVSSSNAKRVEKEKAPADTTESSLRLDGLNRAALSAAAVPTLRSSTGNGLSAPRRIEPVLFWREETTCLGVTVRL